MVDAMEADGFSAQVETEPGEPSPYVVFIRGKGMQVDALRAETPFQMSVLRRAENGIATAEDIIVFKLLAWRTRDKDDIRSILAAGHDLDEGHIELWAAEWEVTERWGEATTWRP